MSSGFSKESELDQTLGMRVVEDKNAIFFSVSIYKHLWVDDHYEFYLKVVDRRLQIPYYPIKRYSVTHYLCRSSKIFTTLSGKQSRQSAKTYNYPSCPKSTFSSGTKTKKSTKDAQN